MTAQRKPGDALFAAFLAAFFALCTWRSLLLWREHPGVDGPAAIPLAASALAALASAGIAAKGFLAHEKTPLRAALSHAFPRDALAALIASAAYCALLLMGVPFLAASGALMLGLCLFLRRGEWKKSLVWSAACALAVWAVFRLAFHVNLP